MSRKTPIKEQLSEDNTDASAPIRRSSRISLSQNSVNSPTPKSVVTRRSSASSVSEKNKATNEDAERTPSGREKKKTRRASTEEEIKPTPIKTRRNSVSKIIEEEKKVPSSPSTPSRKITRALSTSPTTVDVPARRTRRSISASQENEIVEEQLPVRRSTRRKSVDTQENVTNEETLSKSKPSTRRRRSTSADENEETTQNDVRQKTKRLYSEDNLLEPIEEQETTEDTGKFEENIAESSVHLKKGNDLSVIEESDDTDIEDSKKVIKEIDDVLKNRVSSPKPISVTQGIFRSIFSPLTPKLNITEQKTEVLTKDPKSNVNEESKKLKSPSKNKSAKELITNEVHSELEVEEMSKNDSKLDSMETLIKKSVSLDKETTISAPEKIGKTGGIKIADKNYVSMGSDDSFTLHLNMSLDKTQYSEEKTDDDVFSSPGSNKENSSINIPNKSLTRKNEDSVDPKEETISKEVTVQNVEVDVFASKRNSRNSFLEPMEVDCDLDSSKDSSNRVPKFVHEESETVSPKKSKHMKLDKQNEDSTVMISQKVASTDDTEKNKLLNDVSSKDISKNGTPSESLDENPKKMNIDVNEKSPIADDRGSKKLDLTNSTASSFDAEKSFIHVNSFQSDNDKMDSSFDMLKAPSTSEKSQRLSNDAVKSVKSTMDKRENESEDDISSDISIRIVDTDEEDQNVEEVKAVVEEKTVESSFNPLGKGSKRPRISCGTLSNWLQKKEKDSILKTETSVSDSRNNFMKEVPKTIEEKEEISNENLKKQEAMPKEDDKLAPLESSMRKSNVSSSIIEEQQQIEDKNTKEESPKRKSLIKNDEDPKLHKKENEFKENSPRRRSPRLSLKKIPEDSEVEEPKSDNKEIVREEMKSGRKSPLLSLKEKFQKNEEFLKHSCGEETRKKSPRLSSKEKPEKDEEGKEEYDGEPNSHIKEIESEVKSPKKRSSLPLKNKSKKDKEEDEESSGGEETKSEIKENESLKNSDIEELEVNDDTSNELFKNRDDKLENNQTKPSLLQKSSDVKSKTRQSPNSNSDSIEQGNSEDQEQPIQSTLMNCGKKSRSRQSLNDKLDEEENETEEEQVQSIEKQKKSKLLSSGEKSDPCYSLKENKSSEEEENVYRNKEHQKETKEKQKVTTSSEIKSENEVTENEDINKQNQNANIKYSESSDQEDSNLSKLKESKKLNTSMVLESKSGEDDERPRKQHEEIEKMEIRNENNTSCKEGAKKADSFEKNKYSKICSPRKDSATNNSQQKLEKNENKKSEKGNSPTKNTESPLKTKMEKMKACGVNFVNPTPKKSNVKLDDETSAKLDKYLSKKLGTLEKEQHGSKDEKYSEENDSDNEDASEDYETKSGDLVDTEEGGEDGSMSEDYAADNVFLDDMAEEGEEDIPSEGSNDLVDEGESINSTESEIDPDETYDSNDSFLIKDDGEHLELLSGEENYLEVREEYKEEADRKPNRIIPKRKRIMQNEDPSSDEEPADRSGKKKSPNQRRSIRNENKSSDENPAIVSPKMLSKNRKRILQNENISSDEESAVYSSRVSFSGTVEVINEKNLTDGTPTKQTAPKVSPKKIAKTENTELLDNTSKHVSNDFPPNKELVKGTVANVKTKLSPRKVASGDIPAIQVDLVEDFSDENEETEEIEQNQIENSVKEKSVFEERIRSLVEGEKSSTPNNSFSEAQNTSRHNTSARSSSIIVHENVSINEIQDGFLAEKLQQVVNVFCAGIRTSDGNISMNVSLDYVENTPRSTVSDNKGMNDVVVCIEDESLSETEEKAPKKLRHSSRSKDNKNDSNRLEERQKKRRSSNVFTKKAEDESCPKIDNVEEMINTEDLSLLNASFSEESPIQDQEKTTDYESSKKKRKSTGKIERRLSGKRSAEMCSTPSMNKYTEIVTKEQNKIEDTLVATEEIQVGSSKKKRKTSINVEERLVQPNEDTEDSYRSPVMRNYRQQYLKEEKQPKKKLNHSKSAESPKKSVESEVVENEKLLPKSSKDIPKSNDEEENRSGYEEKLKVEEIVSVRDEGKEQAKTKKNRANKKRKHAERVAHELISELTTNKRMKLPEMKCEELTEDDLRHRLPSRNEMSDESNPKIKPKKLKRLQSKLKSDLKSTFLSGLVTDVKNRPRRIMKPSVQMNGAGWAIEEDKAKPSSGNITKCTFKFEKIDSKDFKNQMLFDPRIKRETTSKLLRKKGYYV